MFLVIAFSLVFASSARLSYIDSALSYQNVREKGINRGKDIDKFNKAVNNSLGSPYCAAFVGYCLKANKIGQPKATGLATNYYNRGYKAYSAGSVIRGKNTIEAGDIVIWQRGETIFGHTGFVLSYNPTTKVITTIEGNTNKAGSREGDGVYINERKIQPYNFFRIIGFSKVSY